MLPGPNEGYKVLAEPPGYEPIRTPARKLMATPTPFGGTPLYQIPEEDRWAYGARAGRMRVFGAPAWRPRAGAHTAWHPRQRTAAHRPACCGAPAALCTPVLRLAVHLQLVACHKQSLQ